jgi:hypothetical protein
MYYHKAKRRTSSTKRFNAFTASDVQVMQYIQAKLVLAIYRQCQARRLLFMSLLMGCHCKRKGKIIFMLALVKS